MHNYDYLPHTTFRFNLINFQISLPNFALYTVKPPSVTQRSVSQGIYLSIFAPFPKGRWLHEQNQPIYSYPQHSYKPRGRCCQQWYHLPISSLVFLNFLSVGTRDHFHKNAFGKTHVAHSANMTKPGPLWSVMRTRILLGLNLQEEILKRTSSLRILSFQVMLRTFL